MVIIYKIKRHLKSIVFQSKLQHAKNPIIVTIRQSCNKRHTTTKWLNEDDSYELIGSTAACNVIKKYIRNTKLKHVKKAVGLIYYKNDKHLNFTYGGKYLTTRFKNWILPLGEQSKFYWKPNRPITNLRQMEINSLHIYLSVEVPKNHFARRLGIDVNPTHNIANALSRKVYRKQKLLSL
jgi:hypothetical protein